MFFSEFIHFSNMGGGKQYGFKTTTKYSMPICINVKELYAYANLLFHNRTKYYFFK